MFKMEEPKQGEKFKHFKGENKIYEVIAIARDCENPEKKIIVYKQLYDSEKFSKGTIWIRELNDFCGFKEINGNKVKRFVKIE